MLAGYPKVVITKSNRPPPYSIFLNPMSCNKRPMLFAEVETN